MRSNYREDVLEDEINSQSQLQSEVYKLKYQTDINREQLDNLMNEEIDEKIRNRVNWSSYITIIIATIVAILIAGEYGRTE